MYAKRSKEDRRVESRDGSPRRRVERFEQWEREVREARDAATRRAP